MARFVDGRPSEVFLDVPALNQRFVALRGRVPLETISRSLRDPISGHQCLRLLVQPLDSVLQRQPDQRFPGKIRLLGVASLNLVSVAMGQTMAALEATPKIWDLAAAWLVLDELGCPIRWLDVDPARLSPGQDVAELGFPMLAAGSWAHLARLLPWGEALVQH